MRGGVKNGFISSWGGPFSSKWRWKPQACCFQTLPVWNVLTVFQEASLHHSASCSRVISAEPLICTHQLFLVFLVTFYLTWCPLPIHNLAVFLSTVVLRNVFSYIIRYVKSLCINKTQPASLLSLQFPMVMCCLYCFLWYPQRKKGVFFVEGRYKHDRDILSLSTAWTRYWSSKAALQRFFEKMLQMLGI